MYRCGLHLLLFISISIIITFIMFSIGFPNNLTIFSTLFNCIIFDAIVHAFYTKERKSGT